MRGVLGGDGAWVVVVAGGWVVVTALLVAGGWVVEAAVVGAGWVVEVEYELVVEGAGVVVVGDAPDWPSPKSSTT